MTASQMNRIRTKLARAAALTAEANDLAIAGHADYSLREITARAADDMAAAGRSLDTWDARNRATAEAIAADLADETRSGPRCRYRDCDRAARPGWTTCGRHYSAGRSTTHNR